MQDDVKGLFQASEACDDETRLQEEEGAPAASSSELSDTGAREYAKPKKRVRVKLT